MLKSTNCKFIHFYPAPGKLEFLTAAMAVPPDDIPGVYGIELLPGSAGQQVMVALDESGECIAAAIVELGGDEKQARRDLYRDLKGYGN